jgi:CHASE2 domain-containing sensor protein
MKLNLPKNSTFWAAVIIAAVGVVVEVVHLFVQTIPYLGITSVILLLGAFVLLCLGLILKGF